MAVKRSSHDLLWKNHDDCHRFTWITPDDENVKHDIPLNPQVYSSHDDGDGGIRSILSSFVVLSHSNAVIRTIIAS